MARIMAGKDVAGQDVRAVLIETASNQSFVFQSNKLRDIVGASDLIARVGTEWAMAAAECVGGPATRKDSYGQADPTLAARIKYLEEAPKLGANAATLVEPVVCTSGKAVFLVRDKAAGEEIIYRVTRRALEEAPGLTVRGAVSGPFQLIDTATAKATTAVEVGEIIDALFKTVERLRLDLPPAEARFPFHPMVEPCAVTGLPGEGYFEDDGDPEHVLLSASSIAKRLVAKPEDRAEHEPWTAFERAEADLERAISRNPSGFQSELDWQAVVHADGNGFGQIFLDLASYCAAYAKARGYNSDGEVPTARVYFDLYRELSIALDVVGVHALRAAVSTLSTIKEKRRVRDADGRRKNETRDAIPLAVSVMGGDDLTCVSSGACAIEFTRAYLQAFEGLVDAPTLPPLHTGDTMRDNVISALVHQTKGKKRFGAAAGIAIVKTHHPLHRAFELAEELTKSAKGLVKRELESPALSALDFQVVYGDTSSDLGALRSAWTHLTNTAGADGARKERRSHVAYARPYLVSTNQSRISASNDEERAKRQVQFERRHIMRLDEARAELQKQDKDRKPAFPRSQQHEMREAVLAGPAIADARLKLIAKRYKDRGVAWSCFGGDDTTLFFQDYEGPLDENGGVEIDYMTRLLDAMDLVDIKPKQHEPAPSADVAPATKGADQ